MSHLQSELLLNLEDHEGVIEILSKAVAIVPSPPLCERYLTIMAQVSGKVIVESLGIITMSFIL